MMDEVPGFLRSSAGATNAFRLAYVSARLARVPNRAMGTYLSDEFGLSASTSTVERAVAELRAASPYKRPTGRPSRSHPRPRPKPAMWDWLLVDETALGLRKALITIKGIGRPQADLIDWLGTVPGVRQVIETSFDRELVVVALFRTQRDGERLRALIEEHAPDRGVMWQEVLREERLPASQTWKQLAREAAAEVASDSANE